MEKRCDRLKTQIERLKQERIQKQAEAKKIHNKQERIQKQAEIKEIDKQINTLKKERKDKCIG